ncbi:hypothetical protein [Phenylobacterium sp.]|jgi:hypothetical protein|uniref:hypothetical protein n=1 Tax=Phenylobacterium sp. TaxID=1871053 RepID=UPI002F91E81E
MADYTSTGATGLRRLLTLLGIVSVLSLVPAAWLTVEHWNLQSKDVPPVRLELLKASLQLFGVAVLGGGVAFVFRWFEAERQARIKAREDAQAKTAKEAARQEELRRRNLDVLRTTALEVLSIYNAVKLARRMMRFHGQQLGRRTPTDPFRVREDQYQEIFITLERAQLDLERIKKQVGINRNTLGLADSPEMVEKSLKSAESYIRDVLKEFEQAEHPVMDGRRVISMECKAADFFAPSDDRKRHKLGGLAEKQFFKPMQALHDHAIKALTDVAEASPLK